MAIWPPQVLVLRLRDSVIRMGEELEKAKESEARERENAHYCRLRLEEMKADMSELAQRELEASRKRVDLVRAVGEGRWCPCARGLALTQRSCNVRCLY